MLSTDQIQEIESGSFPEAIRQLASLFPGQLVFSSSLGQEDQVLTAMISRDNLPVNIFTIDTGRLFPELYDLLDRTIARYKIPIQVYFPEAADVENFVSTNGINSFYESVANR